MLLLEHRVRLLKDAWQLERAGEFDRVVELLAPGLTEHLAREPELAYLLGRSYCRLSRYAEAEEVSGRLAPIARAEANSTLRRQWLTLERAIHMHYGNLSSGAAVSRELYELSLESGDERHELTALFSLGLVHAYRCEFDSAIEVFRSGLVTAQRVGWEDGLAHLHHNLGLANRERGNLAAALYHFEQALPHYEEVPPNDQALTSEMERARVLVEMGDVRLAEAIAQRVKAWRLTRGDNRSNIAETHYIHGVILYILGETNAAAENLNQALRIARETRSAIVEAEVLQELSVLALDSGETALAREHMDAAARIYNRMGAPKRAERAWSRIEATVGPRPA